MLWEIMYLINSGRSGSLGEIYSGINEPFYEKEAKERQRDEVGEEITSVFGIIPREEEYNDEKRTEESQSEVKWNM